MRRHYVDNIRWATVLVVVLYHVIYMFNGAQTAGVIGPFYETQYQDGLLYLLYPWFMIILFIVSGMSSRYYLENHKIKEFIGSRTRKLLVPSTIGLFVFQWILGYFNMSISNAFSVMPDTIPAPIMYLIMSISGIGVLWYIQLLWILCMVLAIIRKFEKGKLYRLCEKVNPLILVLMALPAWGMAQIGNTPVITVYRFGIYGFSFLLGYFVFAHDSVIERLSKYWHILAAAAVVLGGVYVYCYFGENYAAEPLVSAPFSIGYAWIAILAIFAGAKKWANATSKWATWLANKSFGLYVFHYLPLAASAYYLTTYTKIVPILAYLLVGIVTFVGGYVLYEIISRIPIIRWCVLGMKKRPR